MKKLIKTFIPFIVMVPFLLTGCSKKSGGSSNNDKPAEPAPTAETLIENVQVVYHADGEDSLVIDNSHLANVLPKQEQWVELKLQIKVKGESEKRSIESATFTLADGYDSEKVELDEGWVKIKGVTNFGLKAQFHFDDTNEDVSKEWATTWTMPATQSITILRGMASQSNYGLSFADTNGFPESTSDANGSLAEMVKNGSYGYAFYAKLQKLVKVTYEFNRLGCFSEVSTWATKWDNRNTYITKDGDVMIEDMTNTMVVDGKLVVDFAEKDSEFTEAPYAFQCWFWNSASSEETSLIKSITLEYIPYIEA